MGAPVRADWYKLFMPPIWMVGLTVAWIGLALLVVAVCVSARRIDEGIGQRDPRSLEPADAEVAGPTGVEVE
jgi:hypothetical protein